MMHKKEVSTRALNFFTPISHKKAFKNQKFFHSQSRVKKKCFFVIVPAYIGLNKYKI